MLKQSSQKSTFSSQLCKYLALSIIRLKSGIVHKQCQYALRFETQFRYRAPLGGWNFLLLWQPVPADNTSMITLKGLKSDLL